MRRKIYLFGDSITEASFLDGGWGSALANNFCRTVDVVLRGYSGYNTRWASLALERVFPVEGGEEAPLAVTVFFGANDACLPDGYGACQHVPLDEYKRNLQSIVATFKKRWPQTLIILITPPPIDEEGRLRNPYAENPSGLPERTNEAAGTYAKACIQVATDSGLPFIDLWSKMQQNPDWKKSYLSDGLHLTAGGNRVVYEEVVEKLKEQGISSESLPMDLPVWSEVDPRDPLKSFE